MIFCRCKSRALRFQRSDPLLDAKAPPPAASQEGGVFHFFLQLLKHLPAPRRAGLVQRRFYFAVLIKLRLSHRYFAPEISVTAATSQHRPMLISETAPMASAGAKAAST